MKHVESVTREYDQVSGITCDICGAHTNGIRWIEPNKNEFWKDKDVTEVTVLYKTGWFGHGDEGGSGTKVDVDICPACFREKLIPWLKSQGVEVKTEEWVD